MVTKIKRRSLMLCWVVDLSLKKYLSLKIRLVLSCCNDVGKKCIADIAVFHKKLKKIKD